MASSWYKGLTQVDDAYTKGYYDGKRNRVPLIHKSWGAECIEAYQMGHADSKGEAKAEKEFKTIIFLQEHPGGLWVG